MLDNSIARAGWIGAMTAAADGEVFDGSARLETSYTRFGEEVEPIVVETDGSRPVIVKRTDIPTADDPKAVELSIAANRIAQVDLDFDPEVLAEYGEEIDLSQFWNDAELGQLLSDSSGMVNPEDMWQGMPEFEQEDAGAFKSIKVNFYNLEDMEEFARLVGQKITEKTKFINFPYIEPENLKAYKCVGDES